jgi:hypothetical protein
MIVITVWYISFVTDWGISCVTTRMAMAARGFRCSAFRSRVIIMIIFVIIFVFIFVIIIICRYIVVLVLSDRYSWMRVTNVCPLL